MRIDLGYGKTTQRVEIDDGRVLEVLHAAQPPEGPTGAEEVRRALQHPIGSPRLKDVVRPGEKICIITSDITRPMPTRLVMPVLLEELALAGVDDRDVTLVFALGSHRAHTEEERRRLAGDEVYERIRCVDSDPSQCVHLGSTRQGTPVDVMALVARADRRICLGNIEYHYFVGYSGGSKAIMPGVSTRAAIQSNHRMMVRPEARAGSIGDNPVLADIEEAAGLCGIDFLLNVVLSEDKRVLRAFAGDRIQAHRAGCRFLDSIYLKPIARRADIVLVSQGGAPKDLNLYQTQKALDNAQHAVREGGTVILVGACQEGLGEGVFEAWLREAQGPDSLVRRVHEEFRLGGHKAAAIAMVARKADICLVSELPDEIARMAFMRPFRTAQQALDEATAKHGERSTVIVMPFGGSTLPRAED